MNSSKRTITDKEKDDSAKTAFMQCLAEKKERRKYLAEKQLSEKLAILETLRNNAALVRSGLIKSSR